MALLGRGAEAAQVQLPPGNGVWLKPASNPVVGNEPALIANLKTRDIRHVFLWLIGKASADYASYAPFIQQAHTNGMTVHAVCATRTSITVGGQPSAAKLAADLNELIAYNNAHPAAPFDGVQVDIEGVTGSTLTNLLSAVSVPETLVFSAAVQPDEFYSNVEFYYTSLLQNTDLDLLIPMLYIMDGISYSGGVAGFPFNFSRIQSRTTQNLVRLPASGGQLMTGLAGYDRQFPIVKATGLIDRPHLESKGEPDGFSQFAFSTNTSQIYSVLSLLAAGKPLVDVACRANTGVSIYRFDYDANCWLDVLELTPAGLRRAIQVADQAGAGHTGYVGTCTWLYHTVFDHYSGRREGLAADDGAYPVPVITVQPLSYRSGLARLRVSLTNANPAERILGDRASAGVHLRVSGGGAFVSADSGTFHAAEGFDSAGNLLANLNGAQILELRRSFLENPAAQQADSGEIVISATGLLTLRYRAWMVDKDSLCADGGTPEPYVARSPNDIHYRDPARFLTHATFVTTLIPETPPTDFGFDLPLRISNGFVELKLNCVPGWTYSIQTSTNLTDWETGVSLPALTDQLIWTDTNAMSFTRRFYRARVH
jgi:hypothetical protein